MNEKEKTTIPIPPVGADGEQSLSYVSNEIIATESEEINPTDENMEEILRQMQSMAEPSYLPRTKLLRYQLENQIALRNREENLHDI